jgi:hypothetical protein
LTGRKKNKNEYIGIKFQAVFTANSENGAKWGVKDKNPPSGRSWWEKITVL